MVRVCVDCQLTLGEKHPLNDTRVTGTFCEPCKQRRMETGAENPPFSETLILPNFY